VIRVFFNEDGFYIAGESVEISRRSYPAVTERGDKIFQSIHHTYKILYNALVEIRSISIQEDVVVYGDSRIIDEVNGYCQPLDDTCDQWVKILRRDIIPTIRSVVFFRKKPASQIKDTIGREHARMLPSMDANVAREIASKAAERVMLSYKNKKTKARDNLRKSWFGDTNGKR
jgi:hypothetical protein